MGTIIIGVILLIIAIAAYMYFDDSAFRFFIGMVSAFGFPILFAIGVFCATGYEEPKVESVTILEPMGSEGTYVFFDGDTISFCIEEDDKLVIKEERASSFVIREVDEGEDAKIEKVVEEGIGNFWVLGKSKKTIRFLDVPRGKLVLN